MSTDWLDDPNLTAAERMARFDALPVVEVRGPYASGHLLLVQAERDGRLAGTATFVG
jgi:hypothetical protein